MALAGSSPTSGPSSDNALSLIRRVKRTRIDNAAAIDRGTGRILDNELVRNRSLHGFGKLADQAPVGLATSANLTRA